MVSTRTQTFAMTGRTTADGPFFQKLNKLSLNPPNKLAQTTNSRRSPGPPRKVTKPSSPTRNSRNRSPKRSNRKTKLTGAQVDQLSAAIPPVTLPHTPIRGHEDDNPWLVEDICKGSTFFPSVIIGAHETVGLSIIGRADKEVRMWEQVLADHQREQPSLAPIVEQKLRDAKEKRALIDESLEENWRVGDPNPAATAIKARLEVLQWALDTSKFEPEAANIRCAMEGYRSGAIIYSTEYTLVWAGKIVDTAPHYRTFTADRTARLNRYFETYGPGWLFYEAPLKVHPTVKPKLCASVALKRSDVFSPLECYFVTQGFWKRAKFVHRMPALSHASPTPEEPFFLRDTEGRVYCGEAGPKLAFRSILDSGATYPTLHNDDLVNLGVDINHYPAQSIQTMHSSTGPVSSRIYELYVSVLDDEGRQLVDENDPVYPYNHQYLGGLCPVAQTPIPLTYDENGLEESFRLSGLLPFVACYLSSTPGRNMLFLGEDRNDVLGSHRMPGQKKWTIEMDPIEPGLPFDRYDNPHITFSHRNGRIVDMDRTDKKHASTITFLNGTPEERIVQSDPGDQQASLRSGTYQDPQALAREWEGEDVGIQGPPPSM